MKRSLCLLLLASVAVAQESYDQLLKHWEYDAKAPLAIQEAGTQDRAGVKVHDISYAVPTGDRAASVGPNGGRVTAYLAVPPGKGPFPAVIYGHWCMPGSEKLNRTEFLDEAVVLARSGVIALLPDHVIARPGFVQDNTPLNPQQVDVLVQQVVNMRRGADLLLARKDVDAKRLAYVGHSCDGEVGGFLSGIDKRFKAIVVMAGPLSDEVMKKSPMFEAYRQKVGPEKFDAFAAKYSWTDAGKYTSHSEGTPKLLQFATDEPFMAPEVTKQFVNYVSDPKEFRMYTAPHALNAEATRDRLQFLAKQFGVKPPDAKLVEGIPPLAQPPWPKE
jgi:dienelactone hydrolase